MADRRVNVKLEGDSRAYVAAMDRAANATDKVQRKADQLDGKNIRPKVEVDGAAKANAQVTQLQEKLNRLERRYTAQFNMNARGAQRDVALIMNSITALGPAAVATAGVAGGALVGLGATLGTTAAGLGAVALALSGVGDAYDKLQKYQDDPTAENLDNLTDAMAKLSQTGRDFVNFLDREMQPALARLRHTSADNLLPGLQEGLSNLQAIGPQVTNLVDKTSEALGRLAAEGGRALSDPFWQDYINFLSAQAGPTMTGFFRITESTARGVANLQQAFNPMARDVIAGLEGMADRFADWSATLTTSNGFKELVSYIVEIAPKVFSTIGSLIGAIGDIAAAAAPLGGPVLSIIQALAETLSFIANIPGVGTGLIAAATAMGMLNLALRAIEISKFSRIGQFIGGLGGSLSGAAINAGVFTEKLTGSAAAGEKVMTGVGKLSGVMNNLGPILAGVAGAIALVGWQYELNRSKAHEFANEIVNGSMSMQEAIAAEEEVIKGRSAIGHLFSGTVNEATDAQARHKLATQEVTSALIAQTWAVDPVTRSTAQARLAQLDYNAALQRFGADSAITIGAAGRYAAATKEVEIAQIMTRDGVDRLTASVMYQNDVMNGAVSADMAAQRSKLAFEQSVARATTILQGHTTSSLEGRDAILSVKESAIQAAQAAGQKAEADATAAGRADGAALSAQAQRDTYLDLAAKTKEPLRSELQALADRVATLPDGNFTVTGTGVINDKIKMNDGTEIPIMTSPLGRGGLASAGRLATGGMVESVLPGYTPGRDVHSFYSPTAGHLMLSGGEGILRPEATRAIGGPAGLEHLNRAARNGGVKGVQKAMAFRDGGVFGMGVRPFSAIADTLHADMSSAITSAAGPILFDMIQKTGSSMFGGGDVLAWARSQVGKPYIWGGVGPAGYDCSGFLSALVNVARGLPPHQRVGTTASFPWAGFRPGLGNGLQIGSSPNTGGGIGHMAGTINGVNVESAGGVGVRVGGPVGANSSMFTVHATLPLSGAAAGGGGGGGSGQWAAVVSQALAMMGLPQSLSGITLRRMQQESGGNPRAINNWDSNARRGTPSKGLMQVIDPTFEANWDARTPKDIWNPLSNIVASMRYAIRRYGSLEAAYGRPGGYSDGGVIPGARSARDDRFVFAQAGERVLTRDQNRAFEALVSTIGRPRRVAAPASAGADGGAGGGRQVNIHNENHFRETVDLDLFNQRQEFAMQGAGL